MSTETQPVTAAFVADQAGCPMPWRAEACPEDSDVWSIRDARGWLVAVCMARPVAESIAHDWLGTYERVAELEAQLTRAESERDDARALVRDLLDRSIQARERAAQERAAWR